MDSNTLKSKKAKLQKAEADLISKELASNLADYRMEQTSMSLDDLCKLLGLKQPSTVMRIEKGTIDLTVTRLVQISKVYGIDPVDLLRKAIAKVR